MIKNTYALVIFLLCVEIAVLYLAGHQRTKKYFEIIPSIFWIYFLPMMASTFGLIDGANTTLAQMANFILPMSLFVLLVSVDVPSILRLGKKALIMFFAGGIGVGIGAVVAFLVFKPMVGSHFWSGFGALVGSWTGGSANMIAVKEALSAPDAVFLPMVIVDAVLPYLWMGLLVIVSAHQHHYDRFNRSDNAVLDEIKERMKHKEQQPRVLEFFTTVLVLALAIVGGLLAKYLSQFLPVIKDVISQYAWVIITVSMLGIVCSFTPLRKIEQYHSNKIGYFLLYFVLTTIGARASINNIKDAAVLMLAGVIIIAVHALILLITARLIRAPLFLAAVASQANLGGVASAPMVAEIYQKGFASVGLLLAILGNIVGTYIGITAGQICRLLQ